MTTPPDTTKEPYASREPRQSAASNRFEAPLARQYASDIKPKNNVQRMTSNRQRLQRTGERDPWATVLPPTTTLSVPTPTSTSGDRTTASYGAFVPPPAAPWPRDMRTSQRPFEGYETQASSPWPPSPSIGSYSTNSMTSADFQSQGAWPNWQGSWPGPALRRTSSDEYRLEQAGGVYHGVEGGFGPNSLQARAATYPQRRPSNRDEFDGPSQLLDKPVGEAAYEPKEEELPQLPVTLYAQEQDEILSKVNDRLSQCAFDFIAKYQFPIPVESDKRPVRVPNDREWSEWVYLLKRLATKRRIPARVLYNGQIKQLITILENSLEMRHAAKHQSRPLKDDRNILQLISSGLQVAKILKDAPAMQYLDTLYVQTETLVQRRRVPLPPTTYAGA
ncbi:hypothetical protein LTS10_006138 [Elasticomyces elasticus]|nr:hypothetical protein LTS10_006138 [Elasticomyces elasticus]